LYRTRHGPRRMRTSGCARRSGGADELASGRRSADCPSIRTPAAHSGAAAVTSLRPLPLRAACNGELLRRDVANAAESLTYARTEHAVSGEGGPPRAIAVGLLILAAMDGGHAENAGAIFGGAWTACIRQNEGRCVGVPKCRSNFPAEPGTAASLGHPWPPGHLGSCPACMPEMQEQFPAEPGWPLCSKRRAENTGQCSQAWPACASLQSCSLLSAYPKSHPP